MTLAESLATLNLADARPRGHRLTLPIYLRDGRPSFTPHPDASVATIAVPDGCEVLSVRGEPMLFVPTEPRIRRAWTAREVWLAARLGDRGFGVVAGPHTPQQIRRKARRRDLCIAVRHLRAQGMTQQAVGMRLGIAQSRVSMIERTASLS